MANGNGGKSVTIEIADADLEILKTGKYALCVAKNCNGTYTVVWQSSTEYSSTNTISWTPAYQLFGTNSFEGGYHVQVDTDLQAISLGQTCDLDAAGVLKPAYSGGSATALTLNNLWRPIHPGVNALVTGFDGTSTSTPIYVAPESAVVGTTTLTPVDEIMVWFDQHLVTSTMISETVSLQTIIDMTQVNSATRAYSNGQWSTPPNAAELAALGVQSTFLTAIVTVIGSVTAALLATKIAAKLTGVYSNFKVNVDGTAPKFEIKYSDNPKRLEDVAFHRAVRDSNGTIDTLVGFVLSALAQSNVEVKKIDVVAS